MAERSALTLEQALDQLARAHPREFVRTRQVLARELQAADDAKGAAALRARKRPPLGAWAVNRLALEAGDDVSALIDAMGKVRAAQLGRGRATEDSAVAQASRHQRELITRLMRRAQETLSEAGVEPSRDLLRRVETTLTAAAAADHKSQSALREGRLDQELAPLGFDVFGGAAPSPRAVARHRDSGQAKPRSSAQTSKEPSAPARLTVVPRPAEEDRTEARRESQAKARAERLAAVRQQRAERHERIEALRRAVKGAADAVKQAKAEATSAAQRVREAEAGLKAARRDLAAAAKRP